MRKLLLSERGENLIPLSEGKRRLKGCKKSGRTLYRWAKDGHSVRDSKEIVKLESESDGQSLCTSQEAYLRFLRTINGIPA
jgi:hypothetical protein